MTHLAALHAAPSPLRRLGIDADTARRLGHLGVADAKQLALCDPAALAARWLDLEDHPNPRGLRRRFERAILAARTPDPPRKPL